MILFPSFAVDDPLGAAVLRLVVAAKLVTFEERSEIILLMENFLVG